MPDNNSSNRGFASMDQDQQREIASKGGQAVPDEKRSFSQDRELAAEAGRKGGEASGGNRQGSQGGRQSGGQGGNQGGQESQQGGQGGQRGGSGNFANDPERASEAGRKGGQQ